MIMGSFDRIATETTHDHGVPSPKGGPKGVWRIRSGPVSMDASLLSAVGECVEAVRSAIPRLGA